MLSKSGETRLTGSSLLMACSCRTSIEVCRLSEAGEDFLSRDEFALVSQRDVVGLEAIGSGNPAVAGSLLKIGDPRSVKRTMVKKENKQKNKKDWRASSDTLSVTNKKI